MQHYPEHHRQIVEGLLLDGRFLLDGDPEFAALTRHLDFYRPFFLETFGLELEHHADYAFLQSDRDSDTFSRDVCIFLGVLCYELDREGSSITEVLSFQTLEFPAIEQMLELSSFREVLEATRTLATPESRKNFYNRLNRRHIIDKLDEDCFRFTPAHKYFLEFARELARLSPEEEG